MGLIDRLLGINHETEMEYPEEVLEVSPGDFILIVQDVFTITGRGTVVTGVVEHGSARVGENIILTKANGGSDRVVKITGIEKFRETLDEAVAGENVGILLKAIGRKEVERGDVLHK